MASYLSAIYENRPKSDRYAEKAMCGWYAMHAMGTGAKRCWVPELSYLWSGSEEKYLRRWIASMFLNLGAQYIVGTLLWL